jgi:hypothetical protein
MDQKEAGFLLESILDCFETNILQLVVRWSPHMRHVMPLRTGWFWKLWQTGLIVRLT